MSAHLGTKDDRNAGLTFAIEFFRDSAAMVSPEAIVQVAAVFAQALAEGIPSVALKEAMRLQYIGDSPEAVVYRARSFSRFVQDGEVPQS